MTKFQLPSEFQKEIAVSTQKVYSGKLNQLAKEGFDTPESLQKDPKSVIAAIKRLTGDGSDDKSKNVRRYYISSIFWVAKFPKKNPYYSFYQKCLPSKVGDTDKDWVKRRDYKSDSD